MGRTIDMRPCFVLASSILTLAPAFCQTPQFTADKLVKTGSVVRGTGHVKAVAGAVTVTADEGTYNTETEGLELSGRVELNLPERGDHYVVRYETGTFVTDQPVSLMADHLTLKNGLLTVSGHVVMAPKDPKYPKARLTGDILTMFMRSGDSMLKGNVRTSNTTSDNPQINRPGSRSFPPEVIKK